MKNFSLFALLFSAVFFFSCAAVPGTRDYTPVGGMSDTVTEPEKTPPETGGETALEGTSQGENNLNSAELGVETLPPVLVQKPDTKAAAKPGPAALDLRRHPIPERIMGIGLAAPEKLAAFLIAGNPVAEKTFVEDLALIYTEEAAIEGVNHDAAFAQMCLETGFLRFGGLVTSDMNNFCGLGSTGPGNKGESFPNPRMGVRAHIQHLKAYATEAPLKQVRVDPRFHYVRLGSSPAISGLSGTWAADPFYAGKISGILERLYNFFES